MSRPTKNAVALVLSSARSYCTEADKAALVLVLKAVCNPEPLVFYTIRNSLAQLDRHHPAASLTRADDFAFDFRRNELRLHGTVVSMTTMLCMAYSLLWRHTSNTAHNALLDEIPAHPDIWDRDDYVPRNVLTK